MTKRRYCKHGNEVTKYACPECHHTRLKKRQRGADRAHFKAQLAACYKPRITP